ncbi:MAG: hypothetical protein QXD70_02040 [Candidatus Bathyarchaeia archaeon]
MANISGRLAKLIDELIRKGIVKNEDEAIEFINKGVQKYGDNFVMMGESGAGGALVPQAKAAQASPASPSDKSKSLDKLRNLVDDLIKRGVVKNEDEAYENIIKSKKFGEGFVLKDKNEPSANPPMKTDRGGEVLYTPALEPDEILDASEKGLVKSSRRPDVIDAEFEDDTLKPVSVGNRSVVSTAKEAPSARAGVEPETKKDATKNILKKIVPALPFLVSGEAGEKDEPRVPLRRQDTPPPAQKESPKSETPKQDTEVTVSKEIKDVFGYQPQKESASQYLTRISDLQKELLQGIKYDLPNKEREMIDSARKTLTANLAQIQKEFKQALKDAKTEAQRKEEAARWGQAVESVGQGLAKIAAGIYGLKHGVDASSGVQFNKTDWQAEFDRILREVEQRRKEAMDVATMQLEEQEANRKRIDEYEKRRYEDLREEAKTKYGAHAQELNRLYDITSDIRQRNMAAENRAREFEAEAKLKKALAEEANELKRQLGEARLEAQKLKDEKKKDDTKEKELAKKKSEYDEAMGRLVSGEVDKKEYDVVLGKINQYLFELGATPEQIQEIQDSTSGLFKTRSSEQKDLAKELKALERQLKASSPADSGRGAVQIPEGMVLVVDKEGRKGMIPADKLREAEARGYRRVDR